MLDIDANKNTNNNNSEEELEDPNGYYLILFRTLTIDKATSTEPTMETDPFNYNTITTALRYTSTVFIGIIINTSTLKKSTAGYRQF